MRRKESEVLKIIKRKLISLQTHLSRDVVDEALDECERLYDLLTQEKKETVYSEWLEERWK